MHDLQEVLRCAAVAERHRRPLEVVLSGHHVVSGQVVDASSIIHPQLVYKHIFPLNNSTENMIEVALDRRLQEHDQV